MSVFVCARMSASVMRVDSSIRDRDDGAAVSRMSTLPGECGLTKSGNCLGL